ncbi:J domain-containing protein [Butyrivibrio sp. VCD2006]|uniref:J domain-containing protein n=1 Tax=Butyrivibrio sp. VCD2006 TaxID=1280664 RepID=UPI00040C94FF|nr:J domain-containing protein [Butyrivibrio sp. VCD2006]
MDINEAYRILGASRSDDEITIKKKYKRLLFVHHPDSKSHRGETSDDGMAAKIIEAYRLIRKGEGIEVEQAEAYEWEAVVNEMAFSERAVYVQYKIYDDEDLPLSKVAQGKYVWDPDLEDFPFFTKSVVEAARDAVSENCTNFSQSVLMEVFHLMMQEYVFPADSARKLGKLTKSDQTTKDFEFPGYIKIKPGNKGEVFREGEPIEIYLSDNKAMAQNLVTGTFLGDISFDDDSLYYVILPLLEEHEVKVTARMQKLIKAGRNKNTIMISLKLTIPDELQDRKVSYKNQILKILKDAD